MNERWLTTIRPSIADVVDGSRSRHLSAKMGDKYLRQLLVIGTTSLVRRAKEKPDGADPRFVALLARKPARVATIAMANKMARIAWAVMARGDVFRPGHVPVLAA